MAITRWSFTHEGRAFSFDLATRLLRDEFLWEASLRCDQKEIGQVAGRVARQSLAPSQWTQSCLKEMAALEIQSVAKQKMGLD